MDFGHVLDVMQRPGALPSVVAAGGAWALLDLARSSFLFVSLLSLPHTLAHELAHVLVGAVTLAHPSGISLLPRKNGGSYVLGQASFRGIGLLNGAFVALAPLLLAPVAIWLLFSLAPRLWIEARFVEWAIAVYLAGGLFSAAIPSRQDLVAGAPSLLFYAAVGVAIYAVRAG